MKGTLTPIQYGSLKGHITTHIGHQKKYDGIVKESTQKKKHLQQHQRLYQPQQERIGHNQKNNN